MKAIHRYRKQPDVFAPATALVASLARRELSSRELLEAYLGRVERHNPTLNAVVTLADAADQAMAHGESIGPLHGLPVTVKDALETAGLRTTAGAERLVDHVPSRDADAVARLRAAGAIVFRKTNLPAYASDAQTYNDVFGTTNNSWDLTRTPGGSSGGSAAAIATGLSALELGSDIGGSLRIPAHFCGVYALKPTYGIVPLRGHIPPPPGSFAETDVLAKLPGVAGRARPQLGPLGPRRPGRRAGRCVAAQPPSSTR